MTNYETKDSGAREHFESGMQRDTEAGKARFDLMIPEGVPYEEQLLTRFAMLLSRGAEKYDARNWEKASSQDEIARAKSSAFRHFFQWLVSETDEDHAAAVIFNLMVVETTRFKLGQQEDEYEEPDDPSEFSIDMLEPELTKPIKYEPHFSLYQDGILESTAKDIQDKINAAYNRNRKGGIGRENLRY